VKSLVERAPRRLLFQQALVALVAPEERVAGGLRRGGAGREGLGQPPVMLGLDEPFVDDVRKGPGLHFEARQITDALCRFGEADNRFHYSLPYEA
jgi:hypothetical protein